MLGQNKSVPRSIAVFGAAGHIGAPTARQLRFCSPATELRLITSRADRVASLAAQFPDAHCVQADLCDPASLEAALRGIEGIFVVTPSAFDEATAMTCLVRAVAKVARPVHIVRITGLEPELPPWRIPARLRALGGTAIQHCVAKDILDRSELPVTYLNIGASYMDNFLLLGPLIKATGTMVWPARRIGYLDPRDVGEIAAHLLLSPDERNLHQLHTVNNGQDLLETEEVAAVLSDVLKRTIAHVGDRDAFIAHHEPMLARKTGRPGSAGRILDFIDFERSKSSFLSLSDLAERFLGRRPTTLRSWFMEHRAAFE